MRASILALAAGLLFGAPLSADDVAAGEALVKKSGCLACHQVSRKVVGPSYVDVAKKYKGQAGAVSKLAQKVKKGGSGVWGAVPMTPHPQLADADIEKMVKYVLSTGSAASAAKAEAPKAEAPKAEAPKAEAPKAAAPAAEEPASDKPKRKKKKAHAPAAHHGGHGEPALAWATDDQVRDLMTRQDCLGCHSGINAVNEPAAKPWPSFKQIEGRYAKSADKAALVKKVKSNEGAAKWGKVPHPTYPGLPEEAVLATVSYILDGKASKAPEDKGAVELSGEDWMRQRSDCFSCHQVAAKVVGPSYRDVAKKYSEKDIPMLVKKVKAGGAGNWGNVPMTAHPNASDEMLEKAVRWILTQK